MSDRFDIEKRAKELMPRGGMRGSKDVDAAIQLARETADAIAEEIETEMAKAIPREVRAHALNDAIGIARSYAIPPEPETREKRLERALREITTLDVPYWSDDCTGAKYQAAGWDACRDRARKALENT